MINQPKRKPIFSATRRDSCGPSPAYKTFLHRTRFIFLFMIISFNIMINSNSITINTSVLCMAESNKSVEIQEHDEPSQEDQIYSMEDFRSELTTYSSLQLFLLFSISYISSILSYYILQVYIRKHGSRRLISLLAFLSSIFSAFVPWTSYYGFLALLVNYFLQGICWTSTILLISIVIRKWSTRKREFFTFALLSSFLELSRIIWTPISAHLCHSWFGWPSIFYVQAIITLFLSIIFFYFYKETPNRHAHVSENELERIQRIESDKITFRIQKVLNCKQYRIIIASTLVHFITIQLFAQYLAIYIHRVSRTSLIGSSWLSSLFLFVYFIFKVILCYVSERRNGLTTNVSIRFLSSFSAIGSFFFLMVLFLFQLPNFFQMIILIVLSIFLSFSWPSIFKASKILTKSFYLRLMVKTHLLSIPISIIISNLIVLIIGAKSYTWDRWRFVFLILAILQLFTNIAFQFIFSFKPATYDIKKEENNPTTPPRPEQIAPVSHPRPSEFSTSFDDQQIVVSIVSNGLDRCDTCKNHGLVHKSCARIPTRKMFEEAVMEGSEIVTVHM